MKRIILDDYNQNIPKEQDVIGSVTTTWGHLALRNGWKIIDNKRDMAKIYRIRKLTARECFRLMGVKDDDISKIDNYPLVPNENGEFIAPEGFDAKELRKLKISESQQYKMAGNSIVVDVLKGVFTQMFRKDAEALF